ncbi:MAG: sulfatase [Kiritimatiellae bacterium]|jgi:N-sulfoglucosamine sulfohydrolase|nr:sulfatase [Kiritimatiellia bacterium]
MNIVYIHSHDTGRYIQPYGYAIPTPNFQKFAEEGVLFRQAFCVGPTCSASRAALLTGQCPHSAGMFGLAHRTWELNDYNQHIIHTLKKVGYESTLIGFQHVVDWQDYAKIGYDNVIRDGRERAPDIANSAVEFLSEKHEKPFFLSVGMTHTHRFGKLFNDGDKPIGDSRYCRPPAPLPDTPEMRTDMADFIESAKTYDANFGIVMDAIKENGLEDNTLVISTTDHGIAFPNMKCTLYDHGTGVMLMMRGPKGSGFENGKVYDSLVTHMDIFPTICEMLNIEKPDWLQGTSLLPLVQDKTEKLHDEIFGEINYHGGNKFVFRSVRTKRYKYIVHYSGDEKNTNTHCCDSSLSKDIWNEYGWNEKETPREQLFDLIFDPNETNNLAQSTELQEVKNDLKSRLEKWMTETNDPLITVGDIPKPKIL